MVSCSRDNSVKFWEASTGICTGTVEEHEGWVRALAVKCDGAGERVGGDNEERSDEDEDEDVPLS